MVRSCPTPSNPWNGAQTSTNRGGAGVCAPAPAGINSMVKPKTPRWMKRMRFPSSFAVPAIKRRSAPSFQNVQQQNLFLRRQAADLVLVIVICIPLLWRCRLAAERAIEGLGGRTQRFPMRDIVGGHRGGGLCQIVENVREQRVVKMHVNRLAGILAAGTIERERNE